MKKRIATLSALLVACASPYCQASSTVFLSRTFHGSASWDRWEYGGSGNEYHGGFDVTVNHPFSYSISDGYNTAWASGWTVLAGPNRAQVGVSGGYDLDRSLFPGYLYGGRYDVRGTWTFRPGQPGLRIDGDPGPQRSLHLTDLTTSQVLIDRWWSCTGLPLVVNPSHVYELELRTSGPLSPVAAFYYSTLADSFGVTLEGATVPAPGTLLLCALGTALIGWLRRRRTLV